MNDITYNIDGIEYTLIEEVGEWDYSWHIGALLRDPDGGLWYTTNSGCSCYSFGDYLKKGVQVKSWQEAVDLAKEDFADNEVATFAERLMAWSRPA